MISTPKASKSQDFMEYMASFEDLKNSVENIESDDSSEVQFIKELKVELQDHKCDLCCEGEFLIDKLLRYGGLINEKYRFVCDKCDKNFVYKSELTKHSSKCSGSKITINRTLNCSDSSVKEKQYSFACPTCNKTHKSKGGLTRHIRSQHNSATHTCAVCKMVFSNFKKFSHHCFKHQHLRQFEHKCPDCDQLFFTDEMLQKHTKTHRSRRNSRKRQTL